MTRCAWCGDDPLYVAYHDSEWGFPVRDETRLFEKISLEGFQSGLSWITILRKRENFRRAFAAFDVGRVARFTARDIQRLLGDAGIVRHRGKIESTINNARRYDAIVSACGSFANYVWQFEPDPHHRARRPTWAALQRMTTTPESHALSKDLKRRGWSFIGPTTMYAFMQGTGLVNDHLHGCHTRTRVERQRLEDQ
ncbi:MAG: DNA-3-methyladenine glycosylase I [Gemmatimonadetes bacterium]|nr:MAG: DNA-3-methyladenine glycosylase I [Gemmatimonadota bacterium]PHX96699.1 MAG: DNA-3-methyladenine glycosylase I [Gemmatimonadota bacterium]